MEEESMALMEGEKVCWLMCCFGGEMILREKE